MVAGRWEGRKEGRKEGTCCVSCVCLFYLFAFLFCHPCCTINIGACVVPVGEGEGGVLIVMHGRSRMTVDPRILAMPGRSTSGFHRPGRQWLHQARSVT